MKFQLLAILVTGHVLLVNSSMAQAPQLINYQGRLLDGTNLANGTYGMELRLFNAPSGGASIYRDSNSVTVADGLYSTFIGDNTVAGNLLTALTNAQVWIEVAVNGAALSPRERLASVAYAVNAWGLNGNAGTSAKHFLGTTDTNALEIRVNGRRALRVEPVPDGFSVFERVNILGGSSANFMATTVVAGTICGGGTAQFPNRLLDYAGFVGGGAGNDAGQSAFMGGGFINSATGDYCVVVGGSGNHARGFHDTIVGGSANRAAGNSSTIGGGLSNETEGEGATVPGGVQNVAAGHTAFAAGYRANANHGGTFVWADHHEQTFSSTESNQFLIRAAGGVGINTSAPVKTLHVNGDVQVGKPYIWQSSDDDHLINFGDENLVHIGEVGADDRMEFRAGAGANKGFYFENGNIGVGIIPTTNKIQVLGGAFCSGSTWVSASDKNLKDDFRPVKPDDVLEKIAALPVATWHYKSEDKNLRHMGPTAQDFHSAFGLGYNDTSIATIDESGVALAAIKALNEKLVAQNSELQRQIAALTARMDTIAPAK